MKRVYLIVLIAVLLAACGPVTEAPAQQPLGTPSADWTAVRLIQSGGIMGMMRTIEVTREGAVTVKDERAKESAQEKLSAADLAELTDLVTGFSFVPPPGPNMSCADCFIYTIEIDSPSGTVSAQTNDVDLATSGLEPLVTFLRETMEAALK